jgi:hypothetical protein
MNAPMLNVAEVMRSSVSSLEYATATLQAPERCEMRTNLAELAQSVEILGRLLADVRQARAALAQNATFPADIKLAREALDRALARVGQ